MADLRKDWQRADDAAAIASLDAIDPSYPVAARSVAYGVLMSRVHPDVADAFYRLLDRIQEASKTHAAT